MRLLTALRGYVNTSSFDFLPGLEMCFSIHRKTNKMKSFPLICIDAVLYFVFLYVLYFCPVYFSCIFTHCFTVPTVYG